MKNLLLLIILAITLTAIAAKPQKIQKLENVMKPLDNSQNGNIGKFVYEEDHDWDYISWFKT